MTNWTTDFFTTLQVKQGRNFRASPHWLFESQYYNIRKVKTTKATNFKGFIYYLCFWRDLGMKLLNHRINLFGAAFGNPNHL